jgi:hypothetical protein
MTHFTSSARILTLAVMCGSGMSACAALRSPFRSSGPVSSPEGVQVTIGRQSCVETSEPDFHGNDLVEERLQIEIRNATPSPVAVHRDAFRLVAPDGVAARTVTWGAASPLTMRGGEARIFELRFMTRGSLTCTGEEELDPRAAVTLRDTPVQMGMVRFVPSRPL